MADVRKEAVRNGVMSRGALKLESYVVSPTLHILKRIAASGISAGPKFE